MNWLTLREFFFKKNNNCILLKCVDLLKRLEMCIMFSILVTHNKLTCCDRLNGLLQSSAISALVLAILQ